MDPSAEQDGPPLTELESLQLKANQTTDESLESTRRMIALCEDVSYSYNAFLWWAFFEMVPISGFGKAVLRNELTRRHYYQPVLIQRISFL